MLRFVHIGDQVNEERDQFAFYDTVGDGFLEPAGQILFSGWNDFVEAWNDDEEFRLSWKNDLARFERLFVRNE